MCKTHTVLKILEFLAKIELSCRLYLKHSGIQNNSLKKVFQRNSDFEISGLEVSKKTRRCQNSEVVTVLCF